MEAGAAKKFIRFWFPVIVYSGIIFCVSSIPSVTVPLSEVQFDKILHILEYLPFGFLVSRGIYGTCSSCSPTILWFLVVFVTLLYGLGDEYHQSFVSGRSSGGIDLLADVIGGVLGGYAHLLFRKKFES